MHTFPFLTTLSFHSLGPRSPPPHIREATPPRRYSNAAYTDRPLASPPRYKGRRDRSISPNRGGYTDTYIPDSVPQRRAREDDIGLEIDVKRRRTDRSPDGTMRPRDFGDSRDSRTERFAEFAPQASEESSSTTRLYLRISSCLTDSLPTEQKDLARDRLCRLRVLNFTEHLRTRRHRQNPASLCTFQVMLPSGT